MRQQFPERGDDARSSGRIRKAAVAGTWYPGHPAALRNDLDEYLARVPAWNAGDVKAVIAPHAGLMFSGHVGAHSYAAASQAAPDVVVLVGPSHYVGFDGVSLWGSGAFETPLGEARIDDRFTETLLHSGIVQELPQAHSREHSLEMQLPFVKHLMPEAAIVPLVMGYQTRATIIALGEVLARAFARTRTLLVASTDLSHFFDAATAGKLDRRVENLVSAFDADGLLAELERYPEAERGRYVACGGGPAVSVMLAARALGASRGYVLKYAHSGEISGDNTGVVGYLAAAFN
jgi:MEMO1 family protein